MYIMFKKSIIAASISFIIFAFLGVASGKEIDWTENIIRFIIVFFATLLILWSKVPYKWKKDQENVKEKN